MDVRSSLDVTCRLLASIFLHYQWESSASAKRWHAINRSPTENGPSAVREKEKLHRPSQTAIFPSLQLDEIMTVPTKIKSWYSRRQGKCDICTPFRGRSAFMILVPVVYLGTKKDAWIAEGHQHKCRVAFRIPGLCPFKGAPSHNNWGCGKPNKSKSMPSWEMSIDDSVNSNGKSANLYWLLLMIQKSPLFRHWTTKDALTRTDNSGEY